MDRITRAQVQALYERALASDAVFSGEHLAPEALQALVERSGAESTRLSALDHVMSCPTCRQGFDLLRTLQHAHSSMDADGAYPRPLLRRFAPARWVPVLLAASLLLAVGVASLRRREGAESTNGVMRGNEALPRAVYPTESLSLDASRDFMWRQVPGAIRYDFELLDANGASLHSASTRDTTYQLPMSISLPVGSYQWLVSAELANSQRVVGSAARFVAR